ncbi:hypothetical protein TTHERM_00607270 (macronuclear) [Tetrahymena thermophila SB210]|uniref:Uncharacterized protein n=1 Tax=Tetrahymena thermophila (strain SB210) TaxID=312017 RepID=Q22YG4_TETTS|nr:hypothetical protein TTHERM_00607270 [Tetrahymena thermophila SB210]EAR90321.1 hypothetical protein TTHERM_00607270 [Tetrahymena thermophila SB210]|eukprot:XP_001010566.1 hypothetical protein TTHERM_00607270 [Tetrahymena thermophila SB210]
MDGDSNDIYLIMRNILFLASKDTVNVASQRNLLNKWFQDSIKSYIMEQVASPLLAGPLQCRSSREVKTYIHNRINQNRPKYMSIIEQYFYFINKFNLGDMFQEKLKKIIKNPKNISECLNYKTYNIKKVVRKQFVCYLLLRYYELFGNQEIIPSFYELWNLCFPSEIQQKKKLSKYDTMNGIKPKTNTQKQKKDSTKINQNLQNEDPCSSQERRKINQNQDFLYAQTNQTNYNFDQSFQMIVENNKINCNQIYHPHSFYSRSNNFQQENLLTQTSQGTNACFQAPIKSEGNLNQNSHQFLYPSFNDQQIIQKHEHALSQNTQNEYKNLQPHQKFDEIQQNNQINNIYLPYNVQQSFQNVQYQFNENLQTQCIKNPCQVKLEQAEKINTFVFPPFSINEPNNQKIETPDSSTLSANFHHQPKPKFEENSQSNFTAITNTFTLSQQNIKIQEPQPTQNSYLPSNNFNLPQVKVEDNQQQNQNINFFSSCNNQQNEKIEEPQISQKGFEIQFNSNQPQQQNQSINLFSSCNNQQNQKIEEHQISQKGFEIQFNSNQSQVKLEENNQLQIVKNEITQSSEFKNQSQLQVKNEETQQKNDFSNSPFSQLNSNIKIQESPKTIQQIQNHIDLPLSQGKKDKIKLNLCLKSLQNTTNQLTKKEEIKIQEEFESTLILQNQNNPLLPQLKSEENTKNMCKQSLNISLNSLQNIQNQQMNSENTNIQGTYNSLNQPNLNLNQKIKQEEHNKSNNNQDINTQNDIKNEPQIPFHSQNMNSEQVKVKIEVINDNKFKINISKNQNSLQNAKKQELIIPLKSQIKSDSDESHIKQEENKLNQSNTNFYIQHNNQQNTIKLQHSVCHNTQANYNLQQAQIKLDDQYSSPNSLPSNVLSKNRQHNFQIQQPSSEYSNQIFYKHPQPQPIAKFEENHQTYSTQNQNQMSNIQIQREQYKFFYPQTNQIPYQHQNQYCNNPQQVNKNFPQSQLNSVPYGNSISQQYTNLHMNNQN